MARLAMQLDMRAPAFAEKVLPHLEQPGNG